MAFTTQPVLLASTSEDGSTAYEVKDLEVLDGVTFNGTPVTEIDFDERGRLVR